MSWDPFVICEEGETPPRPRPFREPEGLGDRLRTAAFAEFQAIRAFRWAVQRFEDVPDELNHRWAEIIDEEEKHYQLIANRMVELGIDLGERPVSPALWRSLEGCETGRQFGIYIASAEDRGRQAGLKLIEFLSERDPKTAAVFQEIVDEEVEHIALAEKFFGWKPNRA